MKERDYEIGMTELRNEMAVLRDKWKIHLLTLSFILSIVICKYFLPVILMTGILHYYSLYLSGLSMDCYLNGDLKESDHYDDRIDYFNYTVNFLILSTYVALIGKVI